MEGVLFLNWRGCYSCSGGGTFLELEGLSSCSGGGTFLQMGGGAILRGTFLQLERVLLLKWRGLVDPALTYQLILWFF